MSSGSLWVIGVLALAASLLAVQHFRIRRIENAWRGIAERKDWVFEPGSGAFYNREEFFLVVPSPTGGIQVSWSAGVRGSASQTILRSRVGCSATFRIDPADKLAFAEHRHNFTTGDAEYDAEFRVTTDGAHVLSKVLDATWRMEHRANPVALECAAGTLEAATDKIIYDEEEMHAYLQLFSIFHARLES